MSDRPRAKPNADQDAFLALQRAADGLMGELAEVLKPHGISPTQYNVLRILRGAGAGCCAGGKADPAAGGMACGDIGGRMLTRDPDMTRLLDRLEARALIARERDRRDRRMMSTRITREGLDVLKALDRPVLDLHARQFGHLARGRLATLLDLLQDVQRRQPQT